jgi:hypothetical protein
MRTLEARPFVSTPSTVAALVGGFTANTGWIPEQRRVYIVRRELSANTRQSTTGYASFPTYFHVLVYVDARDGYSVPAVLPLAAHESMSCNRKALTSEFVPLR